MSGPIDIESIKADLDWWGHRPEGVDRRGGILGVAEDILEGNYDTKAEE